MQSAVSLSLSSPSPLARSGIVNSHITPLLTPGSLRFCGLRVETFQSKSSWDSSSSRSDRLYVNSEHSDLSKVFAALKGNSAPSTSDFDYDLVIIGAGVGGHGAALHAVEKGLKTAIVEGMWLAEHVLIGDAFLLKHFLLDRLQLQDMTDKQLPIMQII